jgi:glycine reductase
MEKIKVVYYINQFFGQEGGEESASIGIKVHEGAFGLAQSFADAYGEDCEVLATIVCGDNYIAEKLEEVTAEIVEIIAGYDPDLFVAGPAYGAGRYGVACGSLCDSVTQKLGIHVITAMNEINPGVQLYRKDIYILETGTNARTMHKDIVRMAGFAKKLINKEQLAAPDVEGYFARGYKKNIRAEKQPAERAVDMLLDKFYGRDFKSEIPLPVTENIKKPAAIPDLSKITIALATDGGLYPAGNPDNMPTANADHFCAYDIFGIDSLKQGDWVIRHNGYDNTYSNADPNRLVPVDSMRSLEKEGFIGKLYDKFMATTGLIATVENATKTGKQMVQYVKDHNIDAVVLTST